MSCYPCKDYLRHTGYQHQHQSDKPSSITSLNGYMFKVTFHEEDAILLLLS